MDSSGRNGQSGGWGEAPGDPRACVYPCMHLQTWDAGLTPTGLSRVPWEEGSAEWSPLEPRNKTSYPRIQQLCNWGKFFKFSIHFPPLEKGAVGISGGSRVRGQMAR